MMCGKLSPFSHGVIKIGTKPRFLKLVSKEKESNTHAAFSLLIEKPNAGEIKEWEASSDYNSNGILGLYNNHQWLWKSLDKRLMGNFVID